MSATLPGVEPTVDLLFAMVGREAAALRDNHFTLHDVLNCITPHNASPSVVSASVDTPKCKQALYLFFLTFRKITSFSHDLSSGDRLHV